MFKVSVIIPVFNAEKFLQKAVESALAQEEVGEVILIEDASIDDSLKICQELAGQNDAVKLIQHADQKNHGAAESRNLGILNASFDYIAFLDADDYYLSGRFMKDNEILSSDEKTDGVYGALGSVLLDDHSKLNKQMIFTSLTNQVDPGDLFFRMEPIGNEGWFHGNTLTVRKEIFDKVGLFEPGLRLTQDTHMWLKMAMKCKLVSGDITRHFAVRGIHENNRSQYDDKVLYYLPLLFKSLLKWSIKEKIEENKKILLWMNYHNYFFQRNSRTRKNRILFILKSAIAYPFLLKYKQYYLQVPIINKLWN